MNPYLEDAIACMKRASRHFSLDEKLDDLCDALIYYTFGLERLFKGILYEVNPLFILESPDFENAVRLVYRDRLIEKHRKQIDRDLKQAKNQDAKVHAFRASMFAAGKFSRTVDSHIGALVQLGEYRDMAAHRTFGEIPAKETWRLMRKTFYPIVAGIAEEFELKTLQFFLGHGEMFSLKSHAEEINSQDMTEQKVNERIEFHRRDWEKKKSDAVHVANAEQRTIAALKSAETYLPVYWTECPACGQKALMMAEVDGENEDGEFVPWGVLVNSLECHYCGLSVRHFEELDVLNLEERVDNSRRSAWK